MEIRIKEKRNKIVSSVIMVVAMIALVSCHHHKKETSPLNPVEIEGKTYQQSVTLLAENANETVTLTDLKTAVKDTEYNADWLTITKQTYTSGSPSLHLTANDNVKDGASTDARSCTVTVTANSGDKVILTVTQEGAKCKNGIDDSHDQPTDQPVYSRQQ